MVALGAERFSSVFCWCFLEGFEEGEGIKLVEGMYHAGLHGDLDSLEFSIAFKVHGLTKGFVEV